MKLLYQKSLYIYLLIGSIILFVWHGVLNQFFLGEGYYYFLRKLHIIKGYTIPNLGDYDNFARIFFQIVTPLFKDNIKIYFIAELIIVVIFFFSFYFVLKKITSSKFIAFTSTILLSTNHLALFEYLAAGNYQRFIQRFPNLIPLVFAFYFLWKFSRSKNLRHLVSSYVLYSISILMGHFSALMLPLFIVFPILQKKTINKIYISLIFIVISFFLTSFSQQKPEYTFFEFLTKEPDILKRILYQIPLITFPLSLINHFSLKTLLLPALLIYLISGILVYKKLPKLFVLYITFFISMVGVMFTYLYTDPRLNVLLGYGVDRYYLLPSFFAVILWSIGLKALLVKSNFSLYLISFILLVIFIFYNTQATWKQIDKLQPQSEMYKVLTTYFNENKNNIGRDSTIIAPYYITFISPLITDVTMRDMNIEFVLPFTGWQKKYWEIKNKVFVFDYNSGKLIDLTDKYRSGKYMDVYEISK